MPKITRVDMFNHPHGVTVIKYPQDWTASTPPIESHTNSDVDIETMLAWFEDRGWIIRRWPGIPGIVSPGARAWLDQPMPIRDRDMIKRVRDTFTRSIRSLPPDQLAACKWSYDFAFEA